MEDKKVCVECECNECKAKFSVWLDEYFKSPETDIDKYPEVEEQVRKKILMHCPVCNAKNK